MKGFDWQIDTDSDYIEQALCLNMIWWMSDLSDLWVNISIALDHEAGMCSAAGEAALIRPMFAN